MARRSRKKKTGFTPTHSEILKATDIFLNEGGTIRKEKLNYKTSMSTQGETNVVNDFLIQG